MLLSSIPGAVADAKIVSSISMTLGSTTLTSAADVFEPGDVGKIAVVTGAGTAGAKLMTTIVSFTSAREVELTAPAAKTVSDNGASIGSDCGPALQTMLDAASDAGGGTIEIDGLYLLHTPVSLPFENEAQHLRIVGTGGDSGFLIAGDATADMITIDNVARLHFEGVNFAGTPGERDDCRRVLNLLNSFVRVRSCGFFGLAHISGPDAAAIYAEVCELGLSDNQFGGCVFSSGQDNAVVRNFQWIGFYSARDRFIDYGTFQGVYISKTGLAFSGAWIALLDQKLDVANATGQSVIRITDTRFDEGCFSAISVNATAATGRRTSRVHIDGAQINNTLLNGGMAIYIARADHVVIKNAAIGWVEDLHNAIRLNDCGDVMLDRLKLSGGATGLLATNVQSLTLLESPDFTSFSLTGVQIFSRVQSGVGGLVAFSKWGRVTDDDFDVPPAVGTVAFDKYNAKIYIRDDDGWVASASLSANTDPLLGLRNVTPDTGTLNAPDTFEKTSGASAWGNSSANLNPTVKGGFRMRIRFLNGAAGTYVRAGAINAALGPNVISNNTNISLGVLQNNGTQVYIISGGGLLGGPYPYTAGDECELTWDDVTGVVRLLVDGTEVYDQTGAPSPEFEHRFTSTIANIGGEFQLLSYEPA